MDNEEREKKNLEEKNLEKKNKERKRNKRIEWNEKIKENGYRRYTVHEGEMIEKKIVDNGKKRKEKIKKEK